MKMFVMLPKLITAVAVVFSSVLANAAEKTVTCDVWSKSGRAQITFLSVEGHHELALLKFDIETGITDPTHVNAGKKVSLNGLLVAQIGQDGAYLFANGDVHSDTSKGALINPQAVTLQGRIEKDGSMNLQVMDADRVIQGGYGLFMQCR